MTINLNQSPAIVVPFETGSMELLFRQPAVVWKVYPEGSLRLSGAENLDGILGVNVARSGPDSGSPHQVPMNGPSAISQLHSPRR